MRMLPKKWKRQRYVKRKREGGQRAFIRRREGWGLERH